MQKLQILFPQPVLTELKEIAAHSDRPVSELVRRAVDDFLLKHPRPQQPSNVSKIPTFKGGKMPLTSKEMKDMIYEDRNRL
jgi:hypothetical protein